MTLQWRPTPIRRPGAFLTGLMLVGAVAPLTAQIPLQQRSVNHAPRLLVANPSIDRAADSAASVAIGDGMRQRMPHVAGDRFVVVSRKDMGNALDQFGFPRDAILTPEVARKLASALTARTLVTSVLGKDGGSRYRLVARFVGLSDDAGRTIVRVQGQGQSLDDFGAAAADAFQETLRAHQDAKDCLDKLQDVKPDSAKAGDLARHALHNDPENGLAHFCLAQSLKSQHAPDSAWVGELDRAVQGDSLSLPAMTQLAQYYQAHADTAAVVLKFQQMVQAAPTNVPLIEAASKVFRQYGHPEAAEQVADRGIALDSTDAAMWDLKSSACVYQSKYTCAVHALEELLAADSTKGDSTFYIRLTVTAAANTDTASLVQSALKWGQVGLRKYPGNATLLGQLLTLYSTSKMWDSVVAFTSRVMALDSTDMTTAEATIQALTAAKVRFDFVDSLARRVIAHGDAQARQNVAGMLVNAGLPLLQVKPPVADTAGMLFTTAIAAMDSTNSVWATAHYLNGIAAFIGVTQMDSVTLATKNCDRVKIEAAKLVQARADLTVGKSSPQAQIAQQSATYLGYIDKYEPHVTSMIKAFKCQ
ncbi:MAG: tetratricopeptide repeat protein [Gemmatimonadales bacterium]